MNHYQHVAVMKGAHFVLFEDALKLAVLGSNKRNFDDDAHIFRAQVCWVLHTEEYELEACIIYTLRN